MYNTEGKFIKYERNAERSLDVDNKGHSDREKQECSENPKNVRKGYPGFHIDLHGKVDKVSMYFHTDDTRIRTDRNCMNASLQILIT